MVHADDEELDLVAAAGAKIVHCPRSNARLQCGTFPLEKALARDIPVALGTDSLASAPTLNIHDEARFAVSVHRGYVSPHTVEALCHNDQILMG
jgi:cytosine/adenosine deaminase-related metal-dependent hydrolase